MTQAVFWSPFITDANLSTPVIVNTYLHRRAWPGPLIEVSPDTDLSMIIVIPAFKEEAVVRVLQCLLACMSPSGSVEVIVVINQPEGAPKEVEEVNTRTHSEVSEWAGKNSSPKIRFHVLYQPDLPRKKAGVGLARKIGMDEAARRFISIDNPDGVIVCLDADCEVQENYLIEIEQFFKQYPDVEGCSVYFEHPLHNLDPHLRNSIIEYELHLRYFIGIQRWAGFPFAYQTVGSSMAVRTGVYCKAGGMNTRQAGEDFYFLHKVIERGAFGEINTTTVFPSSRTSDRVPFGTGRAMLTSGGIDEERLTYNPQIFVDLKVFLDIVELFRLTSLQNVDFLLRNILPTSVMTFLAENDFKAKLDEINTHTANAITFRKRFFHWFNAFLLMKYVHFARDHFYQNIPVYEASAELLMLIGNGVDNASSTDDLLGKLRQRDKASVGQP